MECELCWEGKLPDLSPVLLFNSQPYLQSFGLNRIEQDCASHIASKHFAPYTKVCSIPRAFISVQAQETLDAKETET